VPFVKKIIEKKFRKDGLVSEEYKRKLLSILENSLRLMLSLKMILSNSKMRKMLISSLAIICSTMNLPKMKIGGSLNHRINFLVTVKGDGTGRREEWKID